jgi:hypothetical protein
VRNGRTILCHGLLATAVGLITLAPQIAHTMQNPDPLVGHAWLQGWSASNALAHDFVTPDGTFHYEQSPALYYAQPLYSVYYMSPLLLPFLLIGLVLLVRHSVLIVALGWGVIQYGFLAGIPYENIRFALAIFPPLAVCVGLGASWLVTSWKASPRVRLVVASVATLVIVYGLLTTLRSSVPIISNFVAAKDSDLASARWIEQQIPEPDALIYCLDILLTMEHYTTLRPVQIYEMTTADLDKRLTHPSYAVFNVWTTEHQWRGKSPWIIYHWLLDNPGMTEIGKFGNYTLYRINR